MPGLGDKMHSGRGKGEGSVKDYSDVVNWETAPGTDQMSSVLDVLGLRSFEGISQVKLSR